MKNKKTPKPDFKKVAIILLTAVIAAIVLFVVYMRFVIPYERSSRYTDTIAIREMIISAVEGINTYAPVDHRTGDTYFPEARLYLPAETPSVPLSYRYSESVGDLPQELLVTSRNLINAKASALHGTTHMEELFQKVPELQSCARGVSIQTKPFDNNSPFETVAVADGRTLYLQHEDECPDLAETMQSLKNLKSY